MNWIRSHPTFRFCHLTDRGTIVSVLTLVSTKFRLEVSHGSTRIVRDLSCDPSDAACAFWAGIVEGVSAFVESVSPGAEMIARGADGDDKRARVQRFLAAMEGAASRAEGAER